MSEVLTAIEERTARSWVGDKVSIDDLNIRFDDFMVKNSGDREDALYHTVEETMNHQMAVLTVDKPSATSAEGMSVSYVQNIISMRDRLKELRSTGLYAETGDGGGSVAKLVRTSPR